MYIYCFLCRRPGADKDAVEEMQAPSQGLAVILLAQLWPGIHVIEYMGSYVPGMKGEA